MTSHATPSSSDELKRPDTMSEDDKLAISQALSNGATLAIYDCDITVTNNYVIIRARPELIAAQARQTDDIEKAYGGCHNCYGKGYATVNEYMSGGGQKWKVDNIKPCSCARGKQFAEIKAALTTATDQLGGER